MTKAQTFRCYNCGLIFHTSEAFSQHECLGASRLEQLGECLIEAAQLMVANPGSKIVEDTLEVSISQFRRNGFHMYRNREQEEAFCKRHGLAVEDYRGGSQAYKAWMEAVDNEHQNIEVEDAPLPLQTPLARMAFILGYKRAYAKACRVVKELYEKGKTL